MVIDISSSLQAYTCLTQLFDLSDPTRVLLRDDGYTCTFQPH